MSTSSPEHIGGAHQFDRDPGLGIVDSQGAV